MASPETAFRRDQHPQPHRQLGVHDHRRQAQHMGGAAHVLFHQLHVARRLDVQAAAVEAHALAHQGQLGVAFVTPHQVDQTRLAPRGGGAADGVDGGIILGDQAVAHHHLDPGAEIGGQHLGSGGQFGRAKVGGGGVDQVAHQSGGGDGALDQAAIGMFRPHQTRPVPRRARLVTAEGIGGQGPGLRRPTGGLGGKSGDDGIGSRRQLGRQTGKRPGVVVFRHAHQHGGDGTVGGRHGKRLAGFAGEGMGGGPSAARFRLGFQPGIQVRLLQGDQSDGPGFPLDQMFQHAVAP